MKKAKAAELHPLSTEALLKCQSWNVSVLGNLTFFEALIRSVTLLWLIWCSVEQNVTPTSKHHSLTSGQWECPNDDEWDLFTLPLAGGALFIGPLPCQTWKQEWNHLKLPLVDCYCRSASLCSTVTPMLKIYEWWLQTKYIVFML